MAETGMLDTMRLDTRVAEALAKASFVPKATLTYESVVPSAPEDAPVGVADRLVEHFVQRVCLGAVVRRYADGSWFAEIPNVSGVWANEATEKVTLAELEVVLRGWVEVKLSHGDTDFPIIDGINLNVL